jgi:predicted phosphodiesterase
MTRLLFVGDPHGTFDPVADRAAALSPEAIILLGDQTPDTDGLFARLETIAPVYYILGNHDTDPVWEGSKAVPAYPYLTRHLEELPADRDLTGRVARIGGLRIAGLGGVFRRQVWEPGHSARHDSRAACREATPRHTRFRDGPPAKQWSSIWPEDYEGLAKLRADVLVTHEAPESHRHGFEILGDLARGMQVTAMVHGHHHEGYHAEIAGGIRVTGAEIPAENGFGMGMMTEEEILG